MKNLIEKEPVKQQFYFYVDRKITNWIREKHSISAESKEDAIKQMIAEFNENELDDTETYIQTEHLYDCDSIMDIEDNNGNPTCELFFAGNYERNEMEFLIDNLNNIEI
jgi:hypothetical protein